MIRLDGDIRVVEYKNNKRIIQASLISDTSAEVIANGVSCANIVGLDANDELYFGSDCFTSEAELGILNSSGAWKF